MITRSLPVEEICDRLRPVFGEKIDQLYFQYTIAQDKEEREDVLHLIYTLYLKNLNQLLDRGVLLKPPRMEQISGEYSLAEVCYADKTLFDFKLRESDWKRHICIVGMSGSGKTTLAFQIARELNRHNKPFLIFDWKRSFRPLLKLNPKISLFTIGNEKVTNLFKTNINKPPRGVSPKEWINFLVDLIVESFFASFGVHKVLLETLDEAFEEWGIYKGSENYPTWSHIKWRLEEKSKKMVYGRESGWLESALRIATVLTFGDFGKILNFKGKGSISIEDLLNKKVILELNSLGNVEKKFFCEYVLTYIYKLKKANQESIKEGFDHAIIVDEAHNIFLKKPTTFSNESVTDMVYREMREYGTSLICLDQHVSKISDTVKGNSACIFAFQQQLPEDLDDISRLMQLQDTKNFFTSLNVGESIVKLSERYTEPFLVKVPDNDLRNISIPEEELKSRIKEIFFKKDGKNLGDSKKEIKAPNLKEKEKMQVLKKDIRETLNEQIENYLKMGLDMNEIERLLEERRDEIRCSSLEIIEAVNNSLTRNFSKKLKNSNRLEKLGLNADEQKFIEFLQENRFHSLSTVDLYKMLGFSPRKGNSIKESLRLKGLIKSIEIRNKNGWKKIIRLSDSAAH